VFFTILIFGAFIPYQVMLYPIVILLRELGLYGTSPASFSCTPSSACRS
jgi:ABC-type glycerol-3-phosphate transport system permease component